MVLRCLLSYTLCLSLAVGRRFPGLGWGGKRGCGTGVVRSVSNGLTLIFISGWFLYSGRLLQLTLLGERVGRFLFLARARVWCVFGEANGGVMNDVVVQMCCNGQIRSLHLRLL